MYYRIKIQPKGQKMREKKALVSFKNEQAEKKIRAIGTAIKRDLQTLGVSVKDATSVAGRAMRILRKAYSKACKAKLAPLPLRPEFLTPEEVSKLADRHGIVRGK